MAALVKGALAVVGTAAGLAWWRLGIPKLIARERDTQQLARCIAAGWAIEKQSATCFCGEKIWGRGASFWLDEATHRWCEDGKLHEPFRLPDLTSVDAVNRWLSRAAER